MQHRLALVALGLFLLMTFSVNGLSSAQTADLPFPDTGEVPPSDSDGVVTSEKEGEPASADILPPDRNLAVTAISDLRDEVRLFPGHTDARMHLAQRLYLIGDLDAALDESRAAVALHPDSAKAHAQLGVVLMAKQDWKSASIELREAVRLDPDLTEAHYNLGSAYYALGNTKAAIASYRHTIELQPRFPDARYRLALLLKLTNHPQDAARLLEDAAIGGVPQAQYFLGNAYKHGQGVEKNPSLAIAWWAKAATLGYQPASEALSKLRRQALASNQPERRRQEILNAFRRYRHQLWDEYPDLIRTDPDQSLGITLLQDNRPTTGRTMLLAEAYALSESAQAELARLYEEGSGTEPAQYDDRIFLCFETTAAEGFLPAQKALVRIYAKGLGVPMNRDKALGLLKHVPKQDLRALSDELGLR
ncbi:MAG: sel1 repeat family protein [Nitrospira sp.]|nr:sel1 repeat family protein [Nitrospira sp.]